VQIKTFSDLLFALLGDADLPEMAWLGFFQLS